MIHEASFQPLPRLDTACLNGEEVGRIEQGCLPSAASPVSVVIPTNYRYTVENGHGEEFGPLPKLIQGLAVAAERENIEFQLHLVDDTTEEKAPNAKIARVLSAAFAGLQYRPDTYIFGRREREVLYGLLDRRLPADLNRSVLKHMVTMWGYGPQRVRGDMITGGCENLISFDDDLQPDGVRRATSAWMLQQGIQPQENGFLYMGSQIAGDSSAVENVTADYLRPYLEILGKTPAELAASTSEQIVLASGTRNTKDVALRQYLANGGISPFQTTHNGDPLDFSKIGNTPVGVATGRKQLTPDINAGYMLLHGIKQAQNGDQPLDILAIPAGTHSTYIMRRDTNPDCAVMGRTMNGSASQIPWLLSDGEISKTFGRVRGPYRAEDRLFTIPPSEILMASIPVIQTHNRSPLGFRGGIVSDYFSEELGDALGDKVLEQLHRCPQTGSYLVRIENGQFQLSREVALNIFTKTQEKIVAVSAEISNLQMDQDRHSTAIQRLQQIAAELSTQIEPGFDTFYHSVNDEISKQLQFVKDQFEIYRPLMEATQQIREEGLLPARVFKA